METPRNIWWKVGDLHEFRRALNCASDSAHMVLVLDHEDFSKSRLYVKELDTKAAGSDEGWNFAHPCPPDCNGN